MLVIVFKLAGIWDFDHNALDSEDSEEYVLRLRFVSCNTFFE